MAQQLKKLAIRGIRSFDPETEETIEFYNPLTMIVGANGCGKTTIIECLKYISTGSMPPGVGKGASFVSDPSISDSSQVKANIKVRLEDGECMPTVITRSFQVTKKPNKVEFKALDGTVRFMNPETNQQMSITNKCSDLDKQVPELLKVSPAILDNVIFCHQEESCWPLSEGAVLKKKFDDIFESTRYSKALEAVRKAKVDYRSRSKDLEVGLSEKGAHRKHADELSRDVKRRGDQLEELQREVDGYNEQLEQYETSIREQRAKIVDLEKQQKQHLDLARDAVECRTRIEDKEQSIQHVLVNDSTEKLTDDKANFGARMDQRRQEQQAKKREMDRASGEIVRLRSEIDELNLKMGEALSLENSFKTQKAAYNEHVNALLESHSTAAEFVGGDGSWDSLSSTTLQELLKDAMEKDVDGCKKKMNEATRKVNDKEKECGPIRTKAQKLELQKEALEKEMVALQEKVQAKINDPRYHGSKADKISVRRREADLAVKERDREMTDFNEHAEEERKRLQKVIKDKDDEKNDLTSKLESDKKDLEYKRLNSKHEAEQEAKMQYADLAQAMYTREHSKFHHDSQELQSVKAKVEASYSDMSAVDQHDAPDAVGRYLDTFLKRISHDLVGGRERVTQALRKVSKCDAEVQSLQGRLVDVKDKAKVLNRSQGMTGFWKEWRALRDEGEKLDSWVAGPKPLLEEAEGGDLFKATLEVVSFMSSLREAVYFRRVTLGKEAPEMSSQKCHFCGTAAVEGQDLQTIVANTCQKLYIEAEEPLPHCPTQQEADTLFERAVSLITRVHEHGPDQGKKFADERKSIENRLQEVDAKKCEEEATYAALVLSVTEMESQQLAGQAALRSAEKLIELDEDAKTKKTAVARGEMFPGSQMGTQSTLTVAQIEEQQSTRLDRLQKVQKEKDDLNAELAALQEKRFKLQNALNLASNMQLRITAESDELQNIQKEIDVANDRLTELRESGIDHAEQVWKAAKKEETAVLNSLEQLKTDAGVVHKEQSHFSQLWHTHWNTFEDMRRRLEACKRSMDNTGGVDKIRSESDSKLASIQECDNVLHDLRPQVSSIAADLNSQEATLRNIEENLALRVLQAQLKSLDEKLGRSGNAHVEAQGNLEDEHRMEQRLQQNLQKKVQQTAECTGRMTELNSGIQHIKMQLSEKHYKNIHELHRRAQIDHELHLAAVADLDRYYNVLDASLLKFHSTRIGEVNKIIKELWETTYKGEDIDTIEIVSGEEGATTKASRSYNYRVVMSKNDSPLDMRGRCSAGQRVLASIVIRLALAETFCLASGILTLDEPTTNLDERNKTALASALAKIISLRSTNQVNFQLVCITHDEDFVRVMKNELSAQANIDMPDFYFRVFRKEKNHTGKFFSKIERIPWEDM
jgi:DNA repair protein RAD50